MLRTVCDFPLHIHWSIPSSAPQPEFPEFLRVARLAEAGGLASVQVPLYTSPTQALQWAGATAAEMSGISFRIGAEFARTLEDLRGEPLLKAASELPGRIILHILFPEDEDSLLTLNAAKEFVANLRTLFPVAQAPRFDVEGQSAAAAFLAIQRGDCLWRLPHTAEQIYADALPVLHFGKHVGMTAYVIARETREHAHDLAPDLLPGPCAEHWHDANGWNSPHVWSSAGLGTEGTAAIVGSYDEVAAVLHSFKACGITQVMLRELRWGRELGCFTDEVLPRLRALESKQKAA
jgi:hypothetical protein